MKPSEIFNRTMPFVIAKLILGGITLGISLVLFAVLMGIGWLFQGGGMVFFFIVWAILTGFVRFFLMHYLGYLVKAGHVAVITEALRTGIIPANQVEVGKAMVKERFVEANIYFGIDKLVGAAVRQIQGIIGKAGSMLDFIPGMGSVAGVAQLFVSIFLGYVDECCLGYAFYNKEEKNPWKSSADGVAIYAQNWKSLMKDGAKTTLMVLLFSGGVALVSFVIIGGIFRLLGWNTMIAFVLAVLITWVLKFALVDSWVLVRVMYAYFQVAPSTVLTMDLYEKLCNFSGKFKELFNKGRQDFQGRFQGEPS